MSNAYEILKYCPNYYNIVNFDFQDDDVLSEKIVSIYKKYIFSINTNNKDDISKVEKLDKVLGSYLKDYLFRSNIQEDILTIRVKKDNNILRSFVDNIIKIFANYQENTTRKIYISKWI